MDDSEVNIDQAAEALNASKAEKKAARQAKAGKEAKPAKEVDPRLTKYPALSATFLRGKFEGQLDSAYKDRETNPDKASQYVAALAAGDVSLPEGDPAVPGSEGFVTRSQANKLKALGLEVDEEKIKAGGRGSSGSGEEKVASGNPDYPALAPTFLRGKFKGQVASAHKDRETKTEKASDYVKALKATVAGTAVVGLPEGNEITKTEAQMLSDLGYADHGFTVKAPAPKPEKASKAEAEGEAEAPVEQGKKSARKGKSKGSAITE